MHHGSVTATKFARNVASYLDRVRYTGEPVTITKGDHPVAQLIAATPAGLPIQELAHVLAAAPKLGTSATHLLSDLETLRKGTKNKLENPWD